MSGLIEVKTADLIGLALNWATFCAVYTGMQPTIRITESETRRPAGLIKSITFPRSISLTYTGAYGIENHWYPSSDWECGGPLISRFLLDFTVEHPGTIGAALCDENGMYIGDLVMFGETHLIAACRAIVAVKLGASVNVPAELAAL